MRPILVKYASARAKAQVTGTRESFLPEARSNPRLCYFDLMVIMDKKTKEISVFIDESGSFEADPDSSRYYMVCMVFSQLDTPLQSSKKSATILASSRKVQPKRNGVSVRKIRDLIIMKTNVYIDAGNLDIPRDLPLCCQLPDIIPVGTHGNTIHRPSAWATDMPSES